MLIEGKTHFFVLSLMFDFTALSCITDTLTRFTFSLIFTVNYCLLT